MFFRHLFNIDIYDFAFRKRVLVVLCANLSYKCFSCEMLLPENKLFLTINDYIISIIIVIFESNNFNISKTNLPLNYI